MKSWTRTFLFLLAPTTLTLAVAAGIAAGKDSNAAPPLTGLLGLLLLVVLVLGVLRLREASKLQQTGLRLGQIVGAVALLVLFALAVGVVFFFSCTAKSSV